MNISHELLNEYVASQGLALFAQRKEVDKLKAEIEKLKAENDGLKAENQKWVDESLACAVNLRNTEGLMNIYRASVERMEEVNAKGNGSPYGVEIISTGEYKDGRVETIVGWSDGTITKVWLAKGEENDPYVALPLPWRRKSTAPILRYTGLSIRTTIRISSTCKEGFYAEH